MRTRRRRLSCCRRWRPLRFALGGRRSCWSRSGLIRSRLRTRRLFRTIRLRPVIGLCRRRTIAAGWRFGWPIRLWTSLWRRILRHGTTRLRLLGRGAIVVRWRRGTVRRFAIVLRPIILLGRRRAIRLRLLGGRAIVVCRRLLIRRALIWIRLTGVCLIWIRLIRSWLIRLLLVWRTICRLICSWRGLSRTSRVRLIRMPDGGSGWFARRRLLHHRPRRRSGGTQGLHFASRQRLSRMRRESLLLFRKRHGRRRRSFLRHHLPARNRRRRRGHVTRRRRLRAHHALLRGSDRNSSA